jgi:hypothetical protein
MKANVTFPNLITESGTGSSYNNTILEGVPLQAFAHITISNPVQWLDQVLQMSHTTASTLSDFSGIITTIGGISGTIALFVGWLFKKRQKRNYY